MHLTGVQIFANSMSWSVKWSPTWAMVTRTGNFPCLRGVVNILPAAAPPGKVLRPNAMVPFLGFEVFSRHCCPFRCVLARKVSA